MFFKNCIHQCGEIFTQITLRLLKYRFYRRFLSKCNFQQLMHAEEIVLVSLDICWELKWRVLYFKIWNLFSGMNSIKFYHILIILNLFLRLLYSDSYLYSYWNNPNGVLLCFMGIYINNFYGNSIEFTIRVIFKNFCFGCMWQVPLGTWVWFRILGRGMKFE